jgi:hypothetical protein
MGKTIVLASAARPNQSLARTPFAVLFDRAIVVVFTIFRESAKPATKIARLYEPDAEQTWIGDLSIIQADLVRKAQLSDIPAPAPDRPAQESDASHYQLVRLPRLPPDRTEQSVAICENVIGRTLIQLW